MTKVSIAILSLLSMFYYNSPKLSQNPDKGKELYETYCIACHQADGKGQKGVNPPLLNSPWVTGERTKLAHTVLKGMNETIEIEGVTYKNAMPSHDWLDDQDLADLLTYVRQQFGKQTDAFTAADIKAYRQ
jgi:mono/diheme cytochrome c family protein